MIIQKWIIFDKNTSKAVIDVWVSNNPDICGYTLGITPMFKQTADDEGWTLPHIWEEQID